MPKMPHMRARNDTRSYGLYFRSVTSVCHVCRQEILWLTFPLSTGSRYIYDLYYDKEAISKPLYEWLLKNGYADGNLIAKWKKQGYEKVRVSRPSFLNGTDGGLSYSCAAYDAYRRKRRISTQLAFVEYHRRS